LLRKLAAAYGVIAIDPSPIQQKISNIIGEYSSKFAQLKDDRENMTLRLESGEEAETGIIKQVKVYIASKRSWASVTRCPDVMVTRAWSPAFCRKRTCRSCRMERRWISC